MEVAKNNQKDSGAVAIWDCTMETGKSASAVMVGSAKIHDLAHATKCLAHHPNFKPIGQLFKDPFWGCIPGKIRVLPLPAEGYKTLWQGHIDYHCAIKELCDCVYKWEDVTHQALLKAHNKGKMGYGGDNALSNCNIITMQESPM
ncbi:hypothetical protein ACA910_002779 [Epithemia clementina (nom. ined.)]